MSGFVEGVDRSQSSLFPSTLKIMWPRIIRFGQLMPFVKGLDLGKLGFRRAEPLEKAGPVMTLADPPTQPAREHSWPIALAVHPSRQKG